MKFSLGTATINFHRRHIAHGRECKSLLMAPTALGTATLSPTKSTIDWKAQKKHFHAGRIFFSFFTPAQRLQPPHSTYFEIKALLAFSLWPKTSSVCGTGRKTVIIIVSLFLTLSSFSIFAHMVFLFVMNVSADLSSPTASISLSFLLKDFLLFSFVCSTQTGSFLHCMMEVIWVNAIVKLQLGLRLRERKREDDNKAIKN